MQTVERHLFSWRSVKSEIQISFQRQIPTTTSTLQIPPPLFLLVAGYVFVRNNQFLGCLHQEYTPYNISVQLFSSDQTFYRASSSTFSRAEFPSFGPLPSTTLGFEVRHGAPRLQKICSYSQLQVAVNVRDYFFYFSLMFFTLSLRGQCVFSSHFSAKFT